MCELFVVYVKASESVYTHGFKTTKKHAMAINSKCFWRLTMII